MVPSGIEILKKMNFLNFLSFSNHIRFIELGIKVKLIKMSKLSHPVDVKGDIKKVLRKIKKN